MDNANCRKNVILLILVLSFVSYILATPANRDCSGISCFGATANAVRIYNEFVALTSTKTMYTNQGNKARTKSPTENLIRRRNFLQTLNRITLLNTRQWWGQWSSWSACGRTCGSGVQFKQRHCLGSRYGGIRQRRSSCKGSFRTYRICSSQPCLVSMPSFRKLQCSQLASTPLRGIYYSWKPYGHPEDEIVSNEPCQLVCVSDPGKNQISNIALDGTECKKGWNDGRCVEGKCELIGCDGKIKSSKLRNKCGKCEEQESCTFSSNEFFYNFEREGEHEGEVKVAQIPKGSYDILILIKRWNSANIVLKNKNGSIIFDTSDSSIVELSSKNFLLFEAEFRFRQSTQLMSLSTPSYLLTKGPIGEECSLHLTPRIQGIAAIHYEFKVPKMSYTALQVSKHREPTQNDSENFQYMGELSPIRTFSLQSSSAHSSSIGRAQVLLRQLPVFIASGNAHNRNKLYEDRIAGVETVDRRVNEGDQISNDGEDSAENTDYVPSAEETTSIRGRQENGSLKYVGYSWQVNGLAPCSSTCTSGMQDSYTICKRLSDYEEVEDGFCDPRTRPEPFRKLCLSEICPPRWEASPWSQCSRSCGVGEKRRTVRCWKMISPGFDSTMYNEVCNNASGIKPVESKSCEVLEHCGPLWETSNWSQCQGPCDELGTKYRTVRCSAGNDQQCSSALRPVSQESCRTEICRLNWVTSEWGNCSGVCQNGRKNRKVICSDNQGRRHPDVRCNPALKPETFHPCGDTNCRPEWIAQEWGECSKICGEGIRTRTVLCSGVLDGKVHHYKDNLRCKSSPKPREQMPCHLRMCNPVWLSTSWSECSVSCGAGTKVRQVNCYRDGSPATGCDQITKPIESEACQLPLCPKHATAFCRDKTSVNCILVQRVRLCSHWYYRKACCASCSSN